MGARKLGFAARLDGGLRASATGFCCGAAALPGRPRNVNGHIVSLPLDDPRRLAPDIIDHPAHPLHLVDDAGGENDHQRVYLSTLLRNRSLSPYTGAH